MKTISGLVLFNCLILSQAIICQDKTVYEKNWPHWRGPLANGIVLHGNPPVQWDENTNISWKVKIPGSGFATPIIWEDKLFIQTAIETERIIQPSEAQDAGGQGRRSSRLNPTHTMEFKVLALNRHTGKPVWEKTAKKEFPHEGAHGTASWASNSGVTDGKHYYAYFGSRGLYCYDLDGNLQWGKDLGNMKKRNSFGEGSSPVLSKDKVIINWDHEEQSFITALAKNTGKEIWKVNRDELSTWATPFIIHYKGKSQVIVPGSNRIRSYDEDSGRMLWECGGLTSNPIPTPVYADGIIYVMTGHRGFSLLAIRLDKARGDITDSDAIVWQYDQNTPYVPSPLLVNNRLYFLRRNDEILTCFQAKTGEKLYGPEKLEGIKGVYASPVTANEHVYFAGRNGATVVLKEGPAFKVIAVNVLDEKFDASPAVVGNRIYLRGHSHLYCINSD